MTASTRSKPHVTGTIGAATDLPANTILTFDVVSGQTYNIAASQPAAGGWALSSTEPLMGPDGKGYVVFPNENPNLILPSAPLGSLIAVFAEQNSDAEASLKDLDIASITKKNETVLQKEALKNSFPVKSSFVFQAKANGTLAFLMNDSLFTDNGNGFFDNIGSVSITVTEVVL